jgi:glycosyltransferase involved in cell wall biosynthesis
LKKQRKYKKALTHELMRIRPDITISLLRREINFINDIKDGSRKIGELHINRANYRNFETNDSNFIKNLFAKFWMYSLVSKLKHLDQFVVLTEEDKKAWAELPNICVISDPLSFCPTQRSSLSIKRVIAVGRYVYQKGFDQLLQAWATIERQYPEWQLVVFGDGDRTPYEQLIDDLKINRKSCQLHGRTDDVEKEYCNSSIFVLSSRFEGFGMVLLEAMACGLAVVSFDCPCGPKDIVKDGEDGLLVENGNIDLLASSLSRLMNDETLRQSMSKTGQKNAQRFSIDYVADQWRRLFESLNISAS